MNMTIQQYNELLKRMESLESANDLSQHNFAFIRELINVLKEIPIFRLIHRRAQNNQELKNLQYDVLPRRQRQLILIKNMSAIPKPIQKDFIKNELSLIKGAKSAIKHRMFYELEIKKSFKELLSHHLFQERYNARTQRSSRQQEKN